MKLNHTTAGINLGASLVYKTRLAHIYEDAGTATSSALWT